MIVYKITNIINGKSYIGQTVKILESRFKRHMSLINKRHHKKLPFYRALKKYGEENFDKQILRVCKCKEEMDIWEKIYISKFKTTNRKFGYNMHKGGRGGDTFTNNPNKEEIRKKRSIALKGKYKMPKKLKDILKKVHTGNQYFKGQKHTKETSIKMSKAQMGNQKWLGKKHTEKWKRENSKRMKKYWKDRREREYIIFKNKEKEEELQNKKITRNHDRGSN